MKTRIVFFFAFTVAVAGVVQAADRDPFRTVLPEVTQPPQLKEPYYEQPRPPIRMEPEHKPDVYAEPLDVEVEGVFWDIDEPRVIIDGEIYSRKDKLKHHDARILKIERNDITVLYRGTTQRLKTVSGLDRPDTKKLDRRPGATGPAR